MQTWKWKLKYVKPNAKPPNPETPWGANTKYTLPLVSYLSTVSAISGPKNTALKQSHWTSRNFTAQDDTQSPNTQQFSCIYNRQNPSEYIVVNLFYGNF